MAKVSLGKRKWYSVDTLGFLFRPIPQTKPQPKRAKPQPRTRFNDFLFSWNDFFSTILIIAGIVGAMHYTYQIKKTEYLKEPVSSVSLPVEDIIVDKPAQPVGLPESQPLRVTLSRLGINYPVVNVGKLKDGTMETPNVLEEVTGWYKYSPTPGEIGPSIIVGHVDSYEGPSVFWRLRETVPGDIITVTRKDGKTVKFKVEKIKSFEQNNFPTQQVYGNIDYPGLRLITCGGTFSSATQHYSHNTVVFAKMIEPV